MGGRLDEHDWQKICNVDVSFKTTQHSNEWRRIRLPWFTFLSPS